MKNTFDRISNMPERFYIGDEETRLTFDKLPEITLESRYDVYKSMGKYNGRQRIQDSVTLQRYDRVMKAYESIGFEGISLRGIYYRVVSLFGEPKTDQTYSNYQKTVSDMRDYGILPFDLVLDGTRTFFNHEGYSSKEEFIRSVSASYKIHRWSQKPTKPLPIVEKLAMVDILREVCDKWGIILLAARGFNSKTAWYNVMKQAEEGQKLDLLVFTDYDTSGLSMVGPGREAIVQHGKIGEVTIRRIGLDPEHVEEFSLITREDKAANSELEFACELDAMTPQQARLVVSRELEKYMPSSELVDLIEQEEREREGLSLLNW